MFGIDLPAIAGVDRDVMYWFAYPCPDTKNCGGVDDFHQPGCQENDPVYLTWIKEQCDAMERMCGVTITMGKTDPYGVTCEEDRATHPRACWIHSRLEVPVHRGDSWLGMITWTGGGYCVGDPLPHNALT